ncbi:phospholipase D/nuclease [Hypoxylon sp. NC1633]|nr:phospholipase D/nuclease [Hypoxylon sp. NC1633]
MALDPSGIQYHTLSHFTDPWKRSQADQAANLRDEFPNYHLSDPESLVTTSCVHSFRLGTGASIFTASLLPAIAEAKHEVILVTCFWARSRTLSALKDALEALAADRREHILNARTSSSGADVPSPLRIRICFSSRSFFQKILHTASRDGCVYPPSTWASQLDLPSPEILEAGLIDLRVKSLFFLPFSVMHPKFLIIDRQRAFFPSCNVSWEPWLEGCVEVTGNAVAGLIKFYRNVWDRQLESQLVTRDGRDLRPAITSDLSRRFKMAPVQSHANHLINFPGVPIPTVLLPSSHHRNPRFDIIPWHGSPSPPMTPLNNAMLQLLDMATHSIYMQTPNLTSSAVVDSLLGALKRGVDVSIVTSRRLMILEQIFTAGTTTSLCLRSLIRKYRTLQTQNIQSESTHGGEESGPVIDVEAQNLPLGFLSISYFRSDLSNRGDGTVEEPVQSHLKLTVVDGQWTVLGSGNMDRASWFTSQELGILFHSADIATAIASVVDQALGNRREIVFSSSGMDDQETQRSSQSREASHNQEIELR